MPRPFPKPPPLSTNCSIEKIQYFKMILLLFHKSFREEFYKLWIEDRNLKKLYFRINELCNNYLIPLRKIVLWQNFSTLINNFYNSPTMRLLVAEYRCPNLQPSLLRIFFVILKISAILCLQSFSDTGLSINLIRVLYFSNNCTVSIFFLLNNTKNAWKLTVRRLDYRVRELLPRGVK